MKTAAICLATLLCVCVLSDDTVLLAKTKKPVPNLHGWKGHDSDGNPVRVVQPSGAHTVGKTFQVNFETPNQGRVYYIKATIDPSSLRTGKGVTTQSWMLTDGNMKRVTNRRLLFHCPKMERTWDAKLIDAFIQKGKGHWIFMGRYEVQIWDEKRCVELTEQASTRTFAFILQWPPSHIRRKSPPPGFPTWHDVLDDAVRDHHKRKSEGAKIP